MKTTHTLKSILATFAIFGSLIAMSACSSIGAKSGDEIAYTGPTILDAKTDPGTFELNRDLNPKTDTTVLADVKDFNAKVTDVRLHFRTVPIEVKMKKSTGDQWVASIDKSDLRKLAVPGETMKYEVTISARNAKGQIATSSSPIDIYVKTPNTSVQNS
jgi:hypothetical protein